eukprot:9368015-Pyramimonas_sp.AAC.1
MLGSSATKSSGTILAGAEWNVEPQAVEESGFTRKAGLIAVVPTRHTCIMPSSASTIDYFLGSHDMVRLVDQVRVLQSWHGGPRKPVRLHLRPGVLELQPLVYCSHVRLPVLPPVGPRRAPRSCSAAGDLADHA